MKKFISSIGFIAVTLFSGLTMAAGSVDTTAVMSTINTDAIPTISELGIAVLGVAILIAVFKWVKRVF